MNWLKRVLLLALACSLAHGQAEEPVTNLDELLEQVRQQQQQQRRLNAQREARFLEDKQQQEALLQEARRELQSTQQRNQPLVVATEANTATIAGLEEQLAAQVQDMGDIAAVFREFAGDFAAVMGESPVSAEYPGRVEAMAALAEAETQPDIQAIENLWLLLQEDMTATARLSRYEGTVVAPDGTATPRQVVRIGTFTSLDEQGFLRYIPETGELLALSRQPSAAYVNDALSFFQGGGELGPAIIDPTRGNLLGMLGYTPSVGERIEQGGVIARIILGLGALGLVITLWRCLVLVAVRMKVQRQRRNVAAPTADNPLGRVLIAAAETRDDDEELLQLKLDEAILAEIPALERGTGVIKLLAAIAPLLGLLGTVTGMIITFQAISLYGTGDPKLMAGGISQALVTTVLGLVMAIPLLFGHALVATLSRAVVQQLDEQSAGMLARRIEQERTP